VRKGLCPKIWDYLEEEGLLPVLNDPFVLSLADVREYIGSFKLLREVRPNSVLVVEPNDCHGEVIPSYVRYLVNLGYDADVLMRPEVYDLKPFCRYEDARVRCLALPLELQKHFFALKKSLDRYKRIFFTSHILYQALQLHSGLMYRTLTLRDGTVFGRCLPIFAHFPALRESLDRLVVVEHHFDFADRELLARDKVITLTDFNAPGSPSIGVNPHFFGEVRMTPRSEGNFTNFITVGALKNFRRSCDLLLESVWELHRSRPGAFKITVIGLGELEKIPEEIRPYFDIRGRVDFPALYAEMEASDFFLTLLDPSNIEHDRYLTTGTTGSFQLIYGFAKPCLIHEKFAGKYELTNENSLIYTANAGLAETMRRAMNMGGEEYSSLQSALKETADAIDARSANTFHRIMTGA
jgi:hypothetical protein